MFETVVPTKSSRASRNVLYETLAFSIVVHGLAAGVALVSTLWQVTFPVASPPFVVAFSMVEPPPPPPPPAKPLEVNKPVTTAKVLDPDQIVAPAVIPDEIPIVTRDVITPVAFAAATGLAGGVASGVDQGQLSGVTGGEAGGRRGGTIGSVAPEFPDGRVHIARDRKLPMLPLSQVYPNYPENARMRLWEDEIVVRYIIGKDGRVKEVTVLQPPLREIFIGGTLSAIRSWRFRPLVHDGEKQEVVHELTVYYRLNEGAT